MGQLDLFRISLDKEEAEFEALRSLEMYLGLHANNYPTCRSCGTRSLVKDIDQLYCNPCLTRRRQNYHYKNSYGISYEDVENILQEQDMKCICCSKSIYMPTKDVPRKDYAVIDHCHVTGKMRGLVCSPCNTGIGQLGDNLEGVMKAARYLEKAEESINNGTT